MSSLVFKDSKTFKRLVPIAVVTIAFAHNLWFSWLKWGDLGIDCGRELDVARQLSEGHRLYAEVRYYFGPLPAWINEILFDLFGIHAGVIMSAGVFCAAITVLLVYRLSRRFISRTGATCAAVSFLYMCAFAQLTPNGIFNFVLPYSQAATYGIMFALASVFFLIRHLQRGRSSDFAWSMLFLALTALTKMEILFALTLAHLSSIAGQGWLGRFDFRKAAMGYAGACLGAGLVYGWYYTRCGPALFSDNLLALLNPSYSHFTYDKMGLLDPLKSLCELGLSFAALAAVLAGVGVFGLWSRKTSGMMCTVVAGLAAALAAVIYASVSLELSFRVLPVLAVTVIAYCLRKILWRTERAAEFLPHLVIWSFALSCLLRMVLKTISYHYGFYMLIPSLITMSLFWFGYLPHIGARKRMLRTVFSFAGAGVFAGLSFAHFQTSGQAYARRTLRIHTSTMELLIPDLSGGIHVGACYAESIRLLSTLPAHTHVLLVPQGSALVFCAGLGTDYSVPVNFRRKERSLVDDANLLAHLKVSPPDIIVRTTTDEGTFGGRFGLDYAQESWNWILANYTPAVSMEKDNFLLIMYRKGEPYPFPDVPAELRAR